MLKEFLCITSLYFFCSQRRNYWTAVLSLELKWRLGLEVGGASRVDQVLQGRDAWGVWIEERLESSVVDYQWRWDGGG